MNYRPIPLILIAIFHLIEPITKIGLYSILYKINPFRLVELEIQIGSALHLFEFFCLFPIAGLAILAVKRWSLYVFLGIEVWVFVANFPELVKMYDKGSFFVLSVLIWFLLVNIGYVVYLLIPAIRIAYLDPKIRWWEAKPRYQVDFDCLVDGKSAKIGNVSKSGAFVCIEEELENNRDYELEIELSESENIKINAKNIHRFKINERPGHGLQFNQLDEGQYKRVKALIKKLEKTGAPRRPARRNLLNEIKKWALDLVKTGKGLFPQQ